MQAPFSLAPLVAAALLLPASVLWAQTTASARPDTAATLQEVVVSATGLEQPIQDVQASVQVISARDLEAFTGSSVTHALKMLTGVDARANGTSSFVAIRGLISNAGSPVLVLVDGLRRTGKYGNPQLNLIGLEEVERIEVVRGPMSALYGADATGGVINVITKGSRPGQAFGGSAQITLGTMEGGQRSTTLTGATLRAGTERTGHRISISTRNKGLFRYPETAATTFDLSEIDETFLSYQGVWAVAPGHELRWTLEAADQDDTGPTRLARAPFTPFTAVESERRETYALRYQGVVGAGVLAVDLSQGQAEAATTRSFPTIETTDYVQTELKARYALELADHTLVLGGGWLRDDLEISIVQRKADTTNQHLLLQDEWRFAPNWKLLGGLRWDDFSTFGSVVTPRLSLSYAPGPWSVRVGYGEAFRAPSATEQYSRFVRGRFLILGREDIQPEENRSWELATAYRSDRLEAEWVLFRSDVTNLIQAVQEPAQAGDPPGVTTRSVFSNVGKALLRGSELSASWQVSPAWALTGGWDYLDAKDGITGSRLTQRARHTWRAGVRYAQGPWRLDVQGRYLHDYFASVNVAPPTPTPAPTSSNFGTLDVKLAYRVNATWTTAVGIDNLTNARQPANYSATGSVQDPPGRFFYLQAKAHF